MTASFSDLRPGPLNLITDVAGLVVGNAGDERILTGTTVVLAEGRATAGVDVRAGAPGTRETDALDPLGLVDAVDGVVLSGGSVYGLEAASAVTAWLGARGRGFRMRASPTVAPIVPAAILFDLANGGDKDWGGNPPYRELSNAACEAAGTHFSLGNEGAGLGAVAGTCKGGLGSASIVSDAGFAVGALVAVNAVGSALVPGTDRFWAAPFEIGDEFGGKGVAAERGLATEPPLEQSKLARAEAEGPVNTTIALVATNALLTRVEAKRLAIMAQDGLARALRPSHTPFDGDTVFALATGTRELDEPRVLGLTALGALAADTLARAIARGVYEADGIANIAGYRDQQG